MKIIAFSVLVAFLLPFVEPAKDDPPCTDASLRLRLSDSPAAMSFRVICDEKIVWKAHELQVPFNLGNLLHTETKCLSAAEECYLSVYNTDKALSKHNIYTTYPPPDSFELLVGTKQVFHYDGSASFYKITSDSFCIGDGCSDDDDAAAAAASTDHSTESADEDTTCVDTNLRLTLDEFPGETGYRLQCDDRVVWDEPKWSHLVSNGWSHQTLKEEACVSKHACCVFEVEDHWGDGLSSPQENKAGSFRLVYGYVCRPRGEIPPASSTTPTSLSLSRLSDTVVAKYNGTNNGLFSKLEYKFGACKTIVCMDVDLQLQFDEFPYETGYSLSCDGDSVWEVPVNSYLEAERWAFETVTEKTCVSPFACCQFVVHDSFQDGLMSAPMKNQTGTFQLMYG